MFTPFSFLSRIFRIYISLRTTAVIWDTSTGVITKTNAVSERSKLGKRDLANIWFDRVALTGSYSYVDV